MVSSLFFYFGYSSSNPADDMQLLERRKFERKPGLVRLRKQLYLILVEKIYKTYQNVTLVIQMLNIKSQDLSAIYLTHKGSWSWL